MKRFTLAIFSILALCASAYAATVTVCASGCNATSIQTGINLATDGDTVLVSNGLFTNNVTIAVNKSVSLIGSNVTIAPLINFAVVVTAPGASVTNFTINDTAVAVTVLASNTVISGIRTNAVWYAVTTNASNTTITGGAYDAYTVGGVFLDGATDSTVSGNSFQGDDAILVWLADRATVSGNTCVGGSLCIDVTDSSYATVSNNTATGVEGLRMWNSTGSIISGNTFSGGSFAFMLWDSVNSTVSSNVFKDADIWDVHIQTETDGNCVNNFTSNNVTGGLPLVYVRNASVISNVLTSEVILCNADGAIFSNVTINGTASELGSGLLAFRTDNANLTVTSSFNMYGVYLYQSNGNTLHDSTLRNNSYQGAYVIFSNNTTITSVVADGNLVSGIGLDTTIGSRVLASTFRNSLSGIDIETGEGTIITGNTIENFSMQGMYVNQAPDGLFVNNTIQYGDTAMYFDAGSEHNLIYNNRFNSTNGVFTEGSVANQWNVTPRNATNIVGGNLTAGNFYALANGSGFSQNCTDANSNGLCDGNFTIDTFNVDFYPLIQASDADSDGVPDASDSVAGTASDMDVSGAGSITATIGNGSANSTATGIQSVIIKSGSHPLLNFSYNFSASDPLDFSEIEITVTSTGVVVDLGGQLQTGLTKTVYLEDDDYEELCVEDANIASISSISSNCNGAGEIDFSGCIDRSGNLTIGNVTCVDEGSRFRFSGLRHSGVRGEAAASSSSSGGGGGGGGAPPAFYCGDGTCSAARSETCTSCPKDCKVCSEVTASGSGSTSSDTPVTPTVQDQPVDTSVTAAPDTTTPTETSTDTATEDTPEDAEAGGKSHTGLWVSLIVVVAGLGLGAYAYMSKMKEAS